MSGYDVIGDIHAQADRLELFLAKLGYHNLKHMDGRKIIFLGDFIDRGTQHAKTLGLVRALVEEGTAQAVMGNHEFNAICYAVKNGRKDYIRPHTAQNTGQHALFLEEFPFKSKQHKDALDWFRTLPVYLEKPGFKVIHACWNKAAMDTCAPFLTRKETLKTGAYAAYGNEENRRFRRSLDILLKGPEYVLPQGVSFQDVGGHTRKRCRVLWWEPANGPDDNHLPANRLIEKGDRFEPFGEEDSSRLFKLHKRFNKASENTVFIGHYNIPLMPYLTSESVGCVNFKGHIVGYRWDKGDKGLDPAKLVHL